MKAKRPPPVFISLYDLLDDNYPFVTSHHPLDGSPPSSLGTWKNSASAPGYPFVTTKPLTRDKHITIR